MTISERLIEFRSQTGLSQERFAKRLQMSRHA